MVIKASASTEVRALIDALRGEDEVSREAAVARLAVIGPRAVDRLISAFDGADRRSRVAILRALEAIGDDRGAPLARRALIERGETAVAATAVLRSLLASRHAETAAAALDALIATALDTSNEHRLRLAALEAVQEAAPDVSTRLAEVLRSEPAGSSPVASQSADVDTSRLEAVWQDALEGRLPDEPEPLREALTTRASDAPLNTLRKLVDAVRAREQQEQPSRRLAWRTLRGALHQALALRGSTVALYDLRESLDDIVIPSFLAALHLVGDESCLEPLASLWEKAGDDERSRHQLETTFRAIVRRERIGSRHKVMKRLKTRGSPLAGPR